jgi:hypothetical protein
MNKKRFKKKKERGKVMKGKEGTIRNNNNK